MGSTEHDKRRISRFPFVLCNFAHYVNVNAIINIYKYRISCHISPLHVSLIKGDQNFQGRTNTFMSKIPVTVPSLVLVPHEKIRGINWNIGTRPFYDRNDITGSDLWL